jgi:hypothetical protein
MRHRTGTDRRVSPANRISREKLCGARKTKHVKHSAATAVAETARQIIRCRRSGERDFFASQAEELLIRMLPGGTEEALDRLRTFRSARPVRSPEELGLQSSMTARLVSFIVMEAECALAAYIERPKWSLPPLFSADDN